MTYIDRARAESAARRFGAREWYGDVDRMLDAIDVDGVCVCGPPEMHANVACQSLARGIPTFVEKPPARSLEQTSALVDLAEKHGTFGRRSAS